MFKNIKPDKWRHFIVGIGMGVFLQCFFLFVCDFSVLSASIWSFVASAVISYGFELFSLITGRGHYEVLDAVAGVIGSIIGMGAINLLEV